MVAVAQLVELRIVIPAVVGSNPIGHPSYSLASVAGFAEVVELVDTLDLGSSASGVRVRVSPSAPSNA